MRIGYSTLPQIRIPAIVEGEIIVFDLAQLTGQWSVVCCMPRLALDKAVFLNQQSQSVAEQGAVLLSFLWEPDACYDPSIRKIGKLRIPFLTDPSKRLFRRLGLFGQKSPDRCQSFVFDPEGIVRYCLVHRLDVRGMAVVIEMLKYCQEGTHQPACEMNHEPAAVAPLTFSEFTNTPDSPILPSPCTGGSVS
ncbi:redoxin domain-containing protein [Candidatus Nitronereus thalassa]|uniref:Redoxin domain-containing protein n=1 Tax=Candidatus Nitronereus thalassa TaxID=3020898 RepID=A0ABU3K2Y7_9BACT|nr:redoxin domain-containing protein [Candidatus Nitronereus thalassa]MDT7040746.1 redoxin domain-containing protein [Candidatus Nitronereus thalassa]